MGCSQSSCTSCYNYSCYKRSARPSAEPNDLDVSVHKGYSEFIAHAPIRRSAAELEVQHSRFDEITKDFKEESAASPRLDLRSVDPLT